MLYMTGVMKCIIAPVLASLVFAGLMISSWERDMNIWVVTFIFGVVSILAGIGYSLFFHYSRGVIRALGFVAVYAYFFGMVIVKGITHDGLFHWPLSNGDVFSFDVFYFPFGFLFAGFVAWVMIYPREVLSLSSSMAAGVVVEALREAEINLREADKKRKD